MATLFMDNAVVYGTAAHMTDGMYAEENFVNIVTENGLTAFSILDNGNFRYVLPATKSTMFWAFRFKQKTLPSTNAACGYVSFRDGLNNNVCTLWVDTTGRLVFSLGGPGGTDIVRSVGPVIKADTFHHIELKLVRHATTGSIEVRMDDSSSPTMSATNVNTGSVDISQIVVGRTSPGPGTFVTDIHVWDTTGTRNNNFLGDVGVATLWPNEDVETGWTPRYRHNIGAGILDLRNLGNGDVGISAEDSSTLELGSGDYTVETFVRFNSLPLTNTRAVIIGKWNDTLAPTDQRSWQLSKCGPTLNGGNLEFRVSTTGINEITLFSTPWSPELNRWYHLAVSRSSGQTMLFIDGVMQGVPQTDGNTYFDGSARLSIGCQIFTSGAGTQITSGPAVQGWLDETRITKSFARYTSNFTPTTVPFGRSVGTDAQFANVTLLAGWDSTFQDESSINRTLTGRGAFGTSFQPSIMVTDDGSFQYQTINAEDTPAFGPPRDDTFISASLYFATGILTLGAVPLNNETVTINGQAYTFKNTLTSAFDVKIGADMATSLANLAHAINDDTGEGTLYGTGTTPNVDVTATGLPSPQMMVTARVAGTGGNSITTTETLSNGSWSGATLSGGASIPGPSSFRLTRMPPGVTTIRSVMAITRGYKTDAGTATMKTSFVGPAGTTTDGATDAMTVNPTYRTDVFEADPDTSGPITPATLLQARLRYTRVS